MSEENINIQNSGCHLPEDAILYSNCGCGQHMPTPEKIATFNMETNTLSVVITGELV